MQKRWLLICYQINDLHQEKEHVTTNHTARLQKSRPKIHRMADIFFKNPENERQMYGSKEMHGLTAWQRANARNISQQTLYSVQHIHINLILIYSSFKPLRRLKLVFTGISIPLCHAFVSFVFQMSAILHVISGFVEYMIFSKTAKFQSCRQKKNMWNTLGTMCVCVEMMCIYDINHTWIMNIYMLEGLSGGLFIRGDSLQKGDGNYPWDFNSISLGFLHLN